MILDIKKLGQSKTFKAIIITILIFAICTGIFQAGVFVGFHKASFLFNFGDNYYKAFNKGPMGMGSFRDELSGGHGIAGKIIRISLPTLIVTGPDNIEKVVLINDDTSIHQFRDISSMNKLTVNQYITVLGTPNEQGQIVAKFIRIVPEPSSIKSGMKFNTATSTIKNK